MGRGLIIARYELKTRYLDILITNNYSNFSRSSTVEVDLDFVDGTDYQC